MARDYYSTLGVEKGASDADIKRAYRALAKELHPDVTGDDPRATERFKQVAEAWECLSDPHKRRNYDLFGTKDRPPPKGPGFGGIDVDSVLDQMFPQRKKKPKPVAGEDTETALNITFTESYAGAEKTITDRSRGVLKVVVPGGVATGTRLRLKGQGHKGQAGGPDGDLYVSITVVDDDRFRRDGADLWTEVPVPLKTVWLGGTIDVPLPDGSVKMTLPRSTQGGQVFRLRGKGFHQKSGKRGDALVTIQVQIPTLSPDKTAALLALLD